MQGVDSTQRREGRRALALVANALKLGVEIDAGLGKRVRHNALTVY